MTSYFILVVQFICLSIWVGGILVILLIVAPQVFSTLDSKLAGDVMGPLLRKFSSLVLLSLVVLTLSLFVQLVILSGIAAFKLRIAISLCCLAILLTVYDRYSVAPRLEHLRRTVDLESDQEGRIMFRRLHVRSMLTFAANLFLGFAAVMALIAPLRRP